MVLSNACALIGRHGFYRKAFDNSPRFINLSPNYSTMAKSGTIDEKNIFDEPQSGSEKKLSKAMKSYLERAQAHIAFMQNEKSDYLIGKRHLANMMGENPETFTQKNVNKAIEYLFPSGLYDPRARPIMEDPEKIFPPKREAQFNIAGRPFHSMFYTIKPNYYETLYNIVEKMQELNEFEDNELKKGFLPKAENKANILGSRWVTADELEKRFLEPISPKHYDEFLAAAEKLADHPYSANVKDFIMQYRIIKKIQADDLIIPPLKLDSEGRPYIFVKHCMRNTTRGEVKILGNGSGKITINGQDITYFIRLQHREQVLFPLIFTGMEKKVDVEATVRNGGPTGHAGAIRWGIAWGLRSFVDKSMIEEMRIAGLLAVDWRRRERKKPGQEGARRKFTWKKR